MPVGIVTDIRVSVTSPSSVLVSWMPTDKDNWNGVIRRYTVVYELLRSLDNMTTAPEGSGFGSIFMNSVSIPDVGEVMNNPDPTLVILPLRREQVEIVSLEEYHVYRLAVYYETSQGRSELSSPVTLQTLTSGIKNNHVSFPVLHFAMW